MAKLLLLFCLASIEPFEIDQEITTTPELLERLKRLEENPLNINTATKDELLLIPYINNHLAERVINYREKKPFSKLSELLLLPGINPFLFDRIKSFITVKEKRRKILMPKTIKLLSRFERNIAYSQNKLYNRIKIPYRNLYISSLVEKDYDEDDYFNYYAGSIYYPGKFVIGDYDLDIGMGLLFGKPDFFYAGSGIISGEKGFSPHLSTYEENYLRGIAGEWQRLLLFGSIIEMSDWGKEKLFGASYKASIGRFTGGISDLKEKDRIGLGSFYLDHELAGNLLRFEIASGGSNFQGLKDNLSYSVGIDNGRGLQTLYANIKDSLPTLRNSPFGKNEELLYLNFEKKLIPALSGAIYTELIRENSLLSDFQRKMGIQLDWRPLKGLSFYSRFRTAEGRDNVRLDITYRTNDLSTRTRFETVNTDNGSGFLTYTSFRYSANYILEVRFILYETNGWESRIYEYENGLPGTFTIKQLNGSGRRIYLIIGEKIFPLKGYLKWSFDFKDGISQKLGLAVAI